MWEPPGFHSATYLDTTALPGVHDYELIFTMPGDACDPLTVTFDGGITHLIWGAISDTRRDPLRSGLSYTIWTSTDLPQWTKDTAATASQVAGVPDANDIQTVAVTLSTPAVGGRLFVRVQAAE